MNPTSQAATNGLHEAVPAPITEEAAIVQQRPSLGSLPRVRRGWAIWLPAATDFGAALVALAAVVVASGAEAFPAIPFAPLLLVGLARVLGLYGPMDRSLLSGGTSHSNALPYVGRLVGSALFTWVAALLTAVYGTGGLSPGAQLVLWLVTFALSSAARLVTTSLSRRAEHSERWVVVGDEETAERLKAYKPLSAYARIVSTVAPPGPESDTHTDRESALQIVDDNSADRVVIAAQSADDKALLGLIKTFRSLGVPVSLLPRPLDLLEAPSAVPRRVGGVPLIQVQNLATRESAPYRGPDRRRDRRTKVSVVIPTLNEAGNIEQVLGDIPEDIHEVILVDGRSHDNTVEIAKRARPDIRTLTQPGNGKGDALRAGFAAATGNLIVMLDADGSADPAEIPSFVAALEAGADFAKGSRFLAGGGSTDITPIRRLGNHVLCGTVNVLYRTHFSDLCYGYNAFWTRCLPFISLDAPGFEVETLINLRIAGAGMKISEVPSHEAERVSGRTNLKTFRDGFRILFTILREWRFEHTAGRRRARPELGAEGKARRQDPAHSHST
jgi:Glycosyl transferase family 2